MSAKAKLRALEKIRTIRSLQKTKAQGELLSAKEKRKCAEEHQLELQSEITVLEKDWNVYLTQQSLNISHLAYHIEALAKADGNLQRAEHETVTAKHNEEASISDLKACNFRATQSEDSYRQLQRQAAKKTEELRSNSQEDRISSLWSES